MKLSISADLKLPAEAVTQTFAVLAKRGSGKTYTALVLVEELLKASEQVVVVDPVGVCWGLRASADGRGPGLPIIVMGGEHGDVPLEVTAGETIANFLVEERQSAVLDLSLFRKGEQVRFMTDFAERLYHRNRQPLHLVLDEADAFAPQRPQKGQERMLGAVEDLVRRGRARGLGITLVTQRAAVLNKDVLTQTEVLVALRTTAPQDRNAIDAWVQAHGTPEQRDTLMESLAGLPIGDAWFWSPGWLDVFKRVHIRARETFDSSATPKAGAKRSEPKRLAQVDLAALKTRIAATIEKAKADDPSELRKQVADLKKRIAELERQKPAQAKVETKVREVKAVKASNFKRADATLGRIERAQKKHAKLLDQHAASAKALEHLGSALMAEGSRLASAIAMARNEPQSQAKPAPTVASAVPARRESSNGTGSDGALSGPEQRILDELAELQALGISPADKRQVGLLCGYTNVRSGGFTVPLSRLKDVGLIAYPGPGTVKLTSEGQAMANLSGAPTTADELQQRILAKLDGPRSKILQELISIYPGDVDKLELAAKLGYTNPRSGGFTVPLASLRDLGLIGYPSSGRVVALPVLFLE